MFIRALLIRAGTIRAGTIRAGTTRAGIIDADRRGGGRPVTQIWAPDLPE